MALGFNLVQTCVLVANKLSLVAVTVLVGSPSLHAAFTSEQVSQLVMFSLEIHNFGFGLGLAFFGLTCLLYGYLLFRSGYFPRVIGILVVVAGLSYLLSSTTLLLAPELSPSVAPVLVLSLVGELSFALWLVFKGVNLAEWKSRTAGVEHRPGHGA